MLNAQIEVTENKLLGKVDKRLKRSTKTMGLHKRTDSAATSFSKLIENQASSIHCILAASKDYVVMPVGVCAKTEEEGPGVSFASFTKKPVLVWFDERTVTFVVINHEDDVLSTAELRCNLIGKTPVDLLAQSANYVKQLTDAFVELDVIDIDYEWAVHRLHEFLLSAFCNGQPRTLSVPERTFKFEDNALRVDQEPTPENVAA
jgi:hypothetical protein